MSVRFASPWRHPKTGIYWFRRRVPVRLRPIVGKKMLQRTLGTKDLEEARIRFFKVAHNIEVEWGEMLASLPPPSKKRHGDAFVVAGATISPPDFDALPQAQNAVQPKRTAEWYTSAVAVRSAETGSGTASDLGHGRAADTAPPRRPSTPAGHLSRPIIPKKPPDAKTSAKVTVAGPTTLSVREHWEKYAKSKHLAPSSVKAWLPMLQKLTKFHRKDELADITRREALNWKDELIENRRLSAKTVAEGYIASARNFFAWAIDNDKLDANPFSQIHIPSDKKPKLRPQSLYEFEGLLILSESLRPSDPRVSKEFAAAKRWVPWILAYHGPRVNEVTQARGVDVYSTEVSFSDYVKGELVSRIDTVWVLRLTPEDGTIKTGKMREVVLHPHLVEQGFAEFAKERGPGPLFYDPSRRRDPDSQTPQYVKVGNKLAEWVREIGVSDKNVDPNHGWRHRFNKVARMVRMDPEVRDAIKGHKPRTEGEAYGDEMPLDAMWAEILRVPRIQVKEPTGERPGAAYRQIKSRKRMATARRRKEKDRGDARVEERRGAAGSRWRGGGFRRAKCPCCVARRRRGFRRPGRLMSGFGADWRAFRRLRHECREPEATGQA